MTESAPIGDSTNTSMLFLEDMQPGRLFLSRTIQVSEDDIVSFASTFDTQPFHTDPVAARDSFFQGLVASGWHTAAMTMGLLTNGALPICWGIVGAGVEELSWPNALRPGDSIYAKCEVIDTRMLKSKPGVGMVRVRVQTLNQHGLPVQSLIPSMLVPTKEEYIRSKLARSR